jgi:hypothetical protein
MIGNKNPMCPEVVRAFLGSKGSGYEGKDNHRKCRQSAKGIRLVGLSIECH